MDETKLNNVLDEVFGDVLEHEGITGQKWGVRNGPPYPLKPAQMTKKQKRYNKELLKQKEKLLEKREKYQAKQQKKADKQAKKEDKKARKTPEDREKLTPLTQEERDNAIKYNKVGEVFKHRAEFSTSELSSVIDRFEKETKLSGYVKQSKKDTFDKMEELANKIEKTHKFVSSSTKLYGDLAPVLNQTMDMDLPILKVDNSNKNNDNKNKNKNK